MPRRTIGEMIQGQTLLAVTPETSVRETAKRMAARHVAAALVLEGRELRGIFTERDLLQRVVAPGLDPDATAVSGVMSPEPISVHANEHGIAALRAMTEHNIRHVVVRGRSGDVPYGMLSIRDFVSTEIAAVEREAEFQQQLWEGAR